MSRGLGDVYKRQDKHSTSRNAGYIITGAIASKIPYIGPPIAGVTTMAGFLDGMKYGMWANAAANNKKAILYHCKPKNLVKQMALLIILCLLYTSDAADDTPCVDLGGRRIIKKEELSL
ncbi:hypothetical protein, partial [Staphylococcus aureus]